MKQAVKIWKEVLKGLEVLFKKEEDRQKNELYRLTVAEIKLAEGKLNSDDIVMATKK